MLLTGEIRNMTISNPVYRRLNVTHDHEFLRRVDLLLLVSSGPGRVKRRDAIRRTWWKECVNTRKVLNLYYMKISLKHTKT